MPTCISNQERVSSEHVDRRRCDTRRNAKCYFLQYFVPFCNEKTSKILQDIGQILFFSKFIITHVYCTTGENTFFFSSKILFFSPKNTANLFARLASLHSGQRSSQKSSTDGFTKVPIVFHIANMLKVHSLQWKCVGLYSIISTL